MIHVVSKMKSILPKYFNLKLEKKIFGPSRAKQGFVPGRKQWVLIKLCPFKSSEENNFNPNHQIYLGVFAESTEWIFAGYAGYAELYKPVWNVQN